MSMKTLSSRRPSQWAMAATVSLLMVIVLSLGASAQTEVVMWLSSQPAGVSEWAEAFERQFNEANPDIRLDLQVHPSVSQQREKLILAIAGGTAPDVVYESSNVMGNWVMNGIAQPLDSYLERMGDADDFIPDIIEGVRYGGQTYALPFSMWTNVDLYNMDLLASSGVSIPSNWDELLQAVPALTRFREGGAIDVHGYMTSRNGIFAYIDLQRAVEQQGSTTVEPLGNRVSLRTEEAQRGMEVLSELYRLGMPGAPGSTSLNGVAQGTVAIQHLAPTLSARSLLDQTQQLGVEVSWQPIVGPNADSKMVHHNAGTLFMVKESAQKEAAWRVMEAWVNPDNMVNYILAHGGSLPVRRSVATYPEILELPYADELLTLLAERITTYGAKHPLFSEFRVAAGNFLQQAIEGELAIPTALEQAEDAANQIVSDFRL